MVETEAWHYLAVRISRGEIHLSLRDLSSQLVVEDQLELALTDSTPFLTRVIDHIDRSLFAIKRSWNALPPSP